MLYLLDSVAGHCDTEMVILHIAVMLQLEYYIRDDTVVRIDMKYIP